MNYRERLTTGQSGMSLVELVVSSAITLLVIAGVAAMFARGLNAQAETVNGDTATAQTQVVTMSLEQSLRNARRATVSADGKNLAAEVQVNNVWQCRRWALVVNPSDALKNTLTFTAGGKTTVLATGARPISGALFGPAGTTVEFGSRITYGLRVDIKKTSATADGAILLQATGTGGATC